MKPSLLSLLLFLWTPALLWAQGVEDLDGRLAGTEGRERLVLLVEHAEATQREAPEEALTYGREALALLARFPDPDLQQRLWLSMGQVYYRLDAVDSLRAYVERLDAVADASAQSRARKFHLRGYALRAQDQHEEAQTALETALTQYEAIDDARGRADVLRFLGLTHRSLGDYDEALDYFDQAQRLHEDIGDRIGAANALNQIGITHRRQGDFDAALDFYHQSMRLREAIGDREGVAGSLNNIGTVYRSRGQWDAAVDYYQRSLAIKEALGDQEGMSNTLNNMSRAYLLLGDTEAALEAVNQSLRLQTEMGNRGGMANSLYLIGTLREALGDYDAALTAFTQSLETSEALGDRPGIARALSNIGDIHRDHGDLEAAWAVSERALQMQEAIGDPAGIAIALNNLGLVAESQGHLDEALGYFTRSLAIKEDLNDIQRQANSLINIGNIHRRRGDLEEAEAFFERAMVQYTTVGDNEGIVIALTSLGGVQQEAGGLEAALQFTERAAVLADSIGALPKLRTAYEQQATILETMGRPTEALAAFRSYQAVHDSLFNSESQGVVAELQAQYRTREQQQRIELLESNRRQQRLWVALLLGGLGLLVIIIALLVGRMRLRRRALAAIEEARQAEATRAEELRLANETKSRFLANISHEFRTPLTLTFGPLDDLLGGRFASIEEARPHLETARRNGGRLLRLINQLLDLSKLDAGALLLQARPHDLVAHLQSLAALFDSIAENRGITFTTHLPDAPLHQVYDSDKIEKVVINLLSNAFKFTEPGGKIGLTLAAAADGVQIEVVDTGTGIAEENLPHLFDRFYQVESDTTRTHEGTGIGLALAKELVELHSGTIDVQSRVGFGTTFTVTLPVLTKVESSTETKPADAAVDAAPVAVGDGAAQSITGSLTIPAALRKDTADDETSEEEGATVVLVVEDNADMRAYIRGHLDDLVSVVEAENGRLGVEEAQAQVPDLVLSDVMMPEMDGLELCAAIKADERTSHIPVVLLTARAQVEHRIAGFASGADAYLPKPFNAEELRVRVQTLIAERRRLRRRFAGVVVAEAEGEKNEAAPSLPPREAAFVEKVEAVINEHIGDTQFGVEQLAEELLLSRRQLFRKLRALTEETPSAIIRRHRLERAALLLAQGAETIKEVSYAVGFQSASSFTKAFQQVHGMTPTEYQAQVRGPSVEESAPISGSGG